MRELPIKEFAKLKGCSVAKVYNCCIGRGTQKLNNYYYFKKTRRGQIKCRIIIMDELAEKFKGKRTESLNRNKTNAVAGWLKSDRVEYNRNI